MLRTSINLDRVTRRSERGSDQVGEMGSVARWLRGRGVGVT